MRKYVTYEAEFISAGGQKAVVHAEMNSLSCIPIMKALYLDTWSIGGGPARHSGQENEIRYYVY
jgi:hypothetical protein